MTARLREAPFSGPLAEQLARSGGEPGVRLFWLGQAGFVVEATGHHLLINPYLSDTLEAKYAGTPFPHERLMPAPISPDDLGTVDLVLCTHRHTDHMDPGTLQPLGARLPSLRFVVPASETAQARARIGVGDDRLVPMDAGEVAEALPGLRVRATRAAHEALDTDGAGRHRYLGYALDLPGLTLFHSGDTVPFPGQREEVAALRADLALLPVNGRSAALRKAGFAANMRLDEAIGLCLGAGIPAMIAHHHGLFAFNTASAAAIDAAAAAAPLTLSRAQEGVAYRLEASPD